MFFIIQTIHTALWTTLVSRWSLHSLYLPSKNLTKFYAIRYAVITLVTIIMLIGWTVAIPKTKTFYMGSIVWWISLVVILLWYLSGAYVCKRYKETLISIIVPSVYLCYVDLIALRAGVWHISEATSLEIFPVDELPLEEILFFFLTNTIVAIGSATFDKTKSAIDTYFREPYRVTSRISQKDRFIAYVNMFIPACNEQNLDPSVVSDLETCIVVLDKASKSFSLAANCFPTGGWNHFSFLLCLHFFDSRFTYLCLLHSLYVL